MSIPAAACRNCGAAVAGKYCAECGQETALHPPSAREFLHEFVGHYVALEGALWRTLKKLAVPGALTKEYLAGRRRSYVLPLRLYLTASLVFFVATRLLAAPLVIPAAAMISEGCKGDPSCVHLGGMIEGPHGKITAAQAGSLVRERLLTQTPYAMFFLVPAFAGITRIAWRRRPLNYGEHLVFALHVHAFVFFLAALLVPLPLRGAVALPAAFYLLLAMRRVFGGRLAPLLARFAFVCVSYAALLALTLSTIATVALSF